MTSGALSSSPSRSPSLGPPPNEEIRQAQLDAMKRRATGLLAVAAVVFAVASILEARHPWLGYVRATAEASLVGGLADWFAVTALFRHPLGIPIPHTAIIATRKERIGRILGNFVQSHFLSRDVIAANLRAVRPAARAARWIADVDHSRRVSQQIAAGLVRTLEALPDAELRDVVHELVSARLRATRVAPALGKTLALVLAGDRERGLFNEALRLTSEAVDRNREVIRQKVRAESPWWLPGVVDEKIYERVIGAIDSLLADVRADPDHPLRLTFDKAVHDLIERLQHSPEIIAKAETLKDEWLADPGVEELAGRLWEAMRAAIERYAARADGAVAGPFERGLAELGKTLLANEAVLTEVDGLVIDLASSVVERYRIEIGDLIALTVAGWDPEATSRRFELAVGRDLQFVRINGTLVGGLVGLAIYALSRALG